MAEEPVSRLFIGNLSFRVDDRILEETFEKFGKVVSANVAMRDGRSRGFGFVEFEKPEDAETAKKELQDYELESRPINIDFARPRAPRDGGGGGGGFRERRPYERRGGYGGGYGGGDRRDHYGADRGRERGGRGYGRDEDRHRGGRDEYED